MMINTFIKLQLHGSLQPRFDTVLPVVERPGELLTHYCSASPAPESPPGALAPSQRALSRPQDRFSCTPATPAPALPHQRQPLRLIVRRRPSFAPLTSSLILTHAPPHPASFVTSAGASLSATPPCAPMSERKSEHDVRVRGQRPNPNANANPNPNPHLLTLTLTLAVPTQVPDDGLDRPGH